MTGLRAAVWTEFLKSRRSRVRFGIAIGFSLVSLIGGVLMVIVKDPDAARRLGVLGSKAQLSAATADWPTFFGLIAQAVAIGGAILFAFLTAWVFGREFADRTARGLLAIPTSRRTVVTAKSIVVAGWGAGMSVWVVGLALLAGAIVGMPGWSTDLALVWIGRILLAALLTVALQSTTAFVASAGRGYIPPLAWAVLTIGVSQVLAVLGWGSVFPWAVPALVAGAGGAAAGSVTAVGFLLVGLAIVIGFAATVAWWDRADQTG